jgi:hypothetical protein
MLSRGRHAAGGVATQQRVDQDVDIDVAATVVERSSCGALEVTPHFSAIRPEAAFSGTMTSWIRYCFFAPKRKSAMSWTASVNHPGPANRSS